MEIKYNLTGAERKKLVLAVGELRATKPNYRGAPSFAYEFDGGFMIDKNGTLSFDDHVDIEGVEKLLGGLEKRGFTVETPDRLVIDMPREGLNDLAIANLEKLVESKAALIKKAVGSDSLPIRVSEDKVSFPWFDLGSSPEEVKAYARLIGALCAMAKTLQRVNATPKEVDNEKYAFRCFLLRLGFIGDDYKKERKLLLSKLSGNTAFRNGRPVVGGETGEAVSE